MQQFWKDHGTKILGCTVALVSLLAAGSVALPPPLDAYSALIKSWAAFLTAVLGVSVVVRGYGNTSAIAAEVVNQQAGAVSSAAPSATQVRP